MMKSIWKTTKGKDFYRNGLEYFEYDGDVSEYSEDIYEDKDDNEIGYIITIRYMTQSENKQNMELSSI